jgi:hypothetical protein
MTSGGLVIVGAIQIIIVHLIAVLALDTIPILAIVLDLVACILGA